MPSPPRIPTMIPPAVPNIKYSALRSHSPNSQKKNEVSETSRDSSVTSEPAKNSEAVTLSSGEVEDAARKKRGWNRGQKRRRPRHGSGSRSSSLEPSSEGGDYPEPAV